MLDKLRSENERTNKTIARKGKQVPNRESGISLDILGAIRLTFNGVFFQLAHHILSSRTSEFRNFLTHSFWATL